MFCILWVVFQTLAAVVEGGVSSGSAETLANGGVNNNGAAGGNNASPGAQNGVPINGEPLVAHLVQLGSSFFIQPVGNQVGQAALQQLIPVGALQQGGAFLAGQVGTANVNPQGQLTQGANGGPVTLFALLPQRNAGGSPQGAMLTPGQVQLIPVAGLNNQQQLGAAGRLRFQRSVAARLRRTQPPVMKAMAAEEEEEEEEECSGMELEGKQAK
ncbi:hypothetical protein VZT92_002863 [Zoarces viviparus]|uniref:Uncharacterized protein n=1 Tax=Zoarces viviparus TaxID=48416 RepID=A0AAW1FZP9_ZOAVI